MSLRHGSGILLASFLATAAAQGQQVDLVSRAATPADSAGQSSLTYTNAGYRFGSLSDDGRYSIFFSKAPNVVPGQIDVNTGNDLFLFDHATGATTLVSHALGSTVTTGTAVVGEAVISADGGYVAFVSSQVFLFEKATGVLRAIPGGSGGGLSLSGDGRFLSYGRGAYPGSAAVYDRTTDTVTDLAAGGSSMISSDGNYVAYQIAGGGPCMLVERTTGTVTMVGHAAGLPTTSADGASAPAGISENGAFVLFWSNATNLVAGQVDTLGTGDLFVFERATGEIQLVTHTAGSVVTAIGGSSQGTSQLSRNGRFVAFHSGANNLVTGQVDVNANADDVFLYDRTTGVNTLVSHAAGGPTTTGNSSSQYASVSSDGAYVAFSSSASNLMAGQTGSGSPAIPQAFLYERATGNIVLVSHVIGQPTRAPWFYSPVALSFPCAISGGGGFVLFQHQARDVVNDTSANLDDDVFLFERASSLNQLVSRAGRGSASPNAPSKFFGFNGAEDRTLKTSADGRYVVFTSPATNLVPGQVDTNGVADVFLFDRGSGATTLVSRAVGSETTTPNSTADSSLATISPDGSIVVFTSNGTNLLAGQVDATDQDFFLFERATGTVTLINHPAGQPTTTAGSVTARAAISDDARFVVLPLGGNLGGGNGSLHVLDRQSGTLSALAGSYGPDVDIDANGSFIVTGNGSVVYLIDRAATGSTLVATAAYYAPAISADGRYVAFASTAVNLVPGQVDTPGTYDAFIYDRVTSTTTLVSHTLGSPVTAAGIGGSGSPLLGLSRDGNYVAFSSTSTGLLAGQNDTAGTSDVFLFERSTGLIALVSHTPGQPTTATGFSDYPAISADGSVVGFRSSANNLIAGQSGPSNVTNVFLYERATGIVTLASRTATASAGNAASGPPVLSRSGSHVVFTSDATDLVAEDFNQKTDVFAFGACSAPPVITVEPADLTVPIGSRATFLVIAQNAGGYQWQKDGVDIPGATALSYTTTPVSAPESGTTYRVLVRGACRATTTSRVATLTIADAQAPVASVLSPSGGEYWLVSPSGGPANTQVVSWSMSDNVRICQATVSLLYSSDGGATYQAAPAGGGLPATFGTGGSCVYPGVTTTNLTYTVPTTFPSGTSGSLYKIQVTVTDQAGNAVTVSSTNPFYIVQSNPDTVRTIILSNVARMQTRQGISGPQAVALSGKLQELANHPRVQGVVVDLGGVTALDALYAAYDTAVTANNATSPAKANDVLFAANGIHDYLKSLLAVYTGARYLVLVGDDRIIPMARMKDDTVLLKESAYPAGGDIRAGATAVGQALAGDTFLSDEPLAVVDPVRPGDLVGNLFVADLAIGRLVETPEEITTAIATFIGQNGILDLSLLDPLTGHKALVTGYDFLTDSAKDIRTKWKGVFGAAATLDSSQAPVDGSLIGGNWSLGQASDRVTALRTRLSGNGGARYGVMSLSGHATHYQEGVPGNDFTDIQGLYSSDVYGPDGCATPTLGALGLSGGVIYAGGCHGGLIVPGRCRTDADHSLDLAQTLLSRGIQAYVANTGYGWGLKYGVGYGERLSELMTEELIAGGTMVVGDAVKRAKQRYFLETPRYDPYDQKSLMQWTTYGLPMYAVKTGVTAAPVQAPAPEIATLPLREERNGVVIRKDVMSTSAGGSLLLPNYLTQVNLSFDFTAQGVMKKKNSTGDEITSPGCPDPNGCYYTLNGLATGSTDLPAQPYFIYDSRLSGTSQHGVLWKGGTYDQESGWKPVFSELFSTKGGADGSNHGDAPRTMIIRASAPRLIPGVDPANCRPSDLEVNSVVVSAGEAVKDQTSDPVYTIERKYRTVDLEALYFNNPATPGQNCDRTGPELSPAGGAYHHVNQSTVTFSVSATDPSGVWRVLIVSTDNALDGTGRGNWTPLDLAQNPGTGNWEGTRTVTSGSTRLTYVIQAVDNRGNVTWLDYVSATLPSSGTKLGVPLPVDVAVAPGVSVNGFAPTSGPIGTSVVITGANFVGTTAVTFGGVPATVFTANTASQITGTVPVGAISGPISVTAALGTGTSSSIFTVEAPPTVTGFTPTSGPVGTLVAITGTNFTGVTAVAFGGATAVFVVNTPTQIQAAVPSSAATGKITVTTPFGTGTSAADFTVTAPPAARLYTITPCRVVDTRTNNSPLSANVSRALDVAGQCGVPGTARAVSLNVTVVGPTTAGNLRLYPSDVAVPGASTLNYGPGQTRSNNAIISLSATGQMAALASQASGTVHLIVDLNGYFQ